MENISSEATIKSERVKREAPYRKKWNKNNLVEVRAWVNNDLAATFKQKCVERGVSQASIIKGAIEGFIKEGE